MGERDRLWTREGGGPDAQARVSYLHLNFLHSQMPRGAPSVRKDQGKQPQKQFLQVLGSPCLFWENRDLDKLHLRPS